MPSAIVLKGMACSTSRMFCAFVAHVADERDCALMSQDGRTFWASSSLYCPGV